nr:MAG TPA: hypothetical protein [Caudoviricetes sp.]
MISDFIRFLPFCLYYRLLHGQNVARISPNLL